MTVTTDIKIPPGEERNRALARWEREGKLRAYTVLTGWDENERRQKVRHVDIWDGHSMVKFRLDGRQPWPSEEEFARIALAVMALR